MKRIFIALMAAFSFCLLTMAQQATTLSKDSVGKVKVSVSKRNAADKDGKNTEVTVSSADNDDSVYTAEFTDTPDDSTYVGSSEDIDNNSYSHSFDIFDDLVSSKGASGSVVGIVFVTFFFIFGFPLFIVFIAFYFRYRSRKARYKLVEQALASGQPIPEGVFKESMNLDTHSKGIKNICTGIGLFIFLWAITGSFGIGCIGLLVMFSGIGQLLVARKQSPTNEQK